MKLSLLGTASYLDRTTGGPCPPVGTTLFQPIAFVKRLVNKNSCGLVIAVGSLISLFLIAGPAAADPYKWCAAYRNGGNNCGFTTIEQCRASVSGVGGHLRAKPVLHRPRQNVRPAFTEASSAQTACRASRSCSRASGYRKSGSGAQCSSRSFPVMRSHSAGW